MELDFDTVKALSSRTRIKILNETLSNESTPTDISNSVGRSKSTVSSHLEKLKDAGLLEKDKVEGRRRVVYRPTDKTKAIMNGKNRKVKFSILSSISNAWMGLGLGLSSIKDLFDSQKIANSYDSGQAESLALEQGKKAADTATQADLTSLGTETVLIVGMGFLSISLAGLIYGLLISRIGK